MRRFLTEDELNALRKQFPSGCIVELDRMEDEQAPPKGTRGKVFAVDALGTIQVFWENGSTLGVLYGTDACHRVA